VGEAGAHSTTPTYTAGRDSPARAPASLVLFDHSCRPRPPTGMRLWMWGGKPAAGSLIPLTRTPLAGTPLVSTPLGKPGLLLGDTPLHADGGAGGGGGLSSKGGDTHDKREGVETERDERESRLTARLLQRFGNVCSRDWRWRAVLAAYFAALATGLGFHAWYIYNLARGSN
jgi:hypothetical protein